ncbi:MAG: N-formylglutamate amidohydrolase [Flavobacteriales bacterium]|nr:N-formylglutamate amidohydrolase [Flavobacteriales bacterium]
MKLVLSCEHFDNKLPKQFAGLFGTNPSIQASHRAYDIGAALLFGSLTPLSDHHFTYAYSRLLIEPNRSLHHPRLFSEFSKTLSLDQKSELIEKFYKPYRNQVEACIGKVIESSDSVLHLSVHSFSPDLNGEDRNAEIGLLYDPSRSSEKEFARRFKRAIMTLAPHLKVRYNYPYLGKADGFTTHLRKSFPNAYSGIELEVRNDVLSTETCVSIHKALKQVKAAF